MNVIIKIAIIMFIIDLVYINLIAKSMYSDVVNKIQNSPININIRYALITYIIMTFGLYYFIISQNKKPKDAFLLGLLVYGVFDFTNLALFKNYTFKVAIIDTIWGATLFYLTTKIIKN